ncbi:MAG: hypothetical protein U1G05_00650 [Kiritimatiellia bacterium]
MAGEVAAAAKPRFLAPVDILRGLLIYASGDGAAMLISGRFCWLRLAGMALAGGLWYAWEIPLVYRWIERRTESLAGRARSLARTGWAMLYFNPLWIARHLLWIRLLEGVRPLADFGLLAIATKSFVTSIPMAVAANHVIQNHIPMRWRFPASALFSALMAVYYALSEIWFA